VFSAITKGVAQTRSWLAGIYVRECTGGICGGCKVVGGGWLGWLDSGWGVLEQQLVLLGQNATSTWPQCGQSGGPSSRLSTCLPYADMFACVPGILIHRKGKQKRKSQAICEHSQSHLKVWEMRKL